MRHIERRVAQNKTTEFVDAEQDILAAIKWAGLNYPQAKLILWGSSYSSSLALRGCRRES